MLNLVVHRLQIGYGQRESLHQTAFLEQAGQLVAVAQRAYLCGYTCGCVDGGEPSVGVSRVLRPVEHAISTEGHRLEERFYSQFVLLAYLGSLARELVYLIEMTVGRHGIEVAVLVASQRHKVVNYLFSVAVNAIEVTRATHTRQLTRLCVYDTKTGHFQLAVVSHLILCQRIHRVGCIIVSHVRHTALSIALDGFQRRKGLGIIHNVFCRLVSFIIVRRIILIAIGVDFAVEILASAHLLHVIIARNLLQQRHLSRVVGVECHPTNLRCRAKALGIFFQLVNTIRIKGLAVIDSRLRLYCRSWPQCQHSK